MIRNYIKIALRNLWKDRTFTSLNIIGLSVAFGVAFLLGTYAFFELSYDQFHKNKGSIYQMYTLSQTQDGQESEEGYPIPFAPTLKQEVPGVAKIARYEDRSCLVTYGDKTFDLAAVWTEPDFFDIFSFPVISGDAENPLSATSSIAITEGTAKKLFGDEDPIGKTLLLQRDGKQEPITVTAILQDLPVASSMDFEIALNFKMLPNSFFAQNIDNWNAYNHEVFVQLGKGMTVAQFEQSTNAFSNLHFAEEIASAKRDGAQPNAAGNFKQIRLLPVENISFASFGGGEGAVSRNLQYLILAIAALILFIASVNFINMSIAKGGQRLREIGMRKTLGAGKMQLFLQFWGESILVFLTSICLGVLLALLLLDPFQSLFRTKASFALMANPNIIFGSIFGLVLITFIAGGYPALLMSKLGTLQALKGKLEVAGRNRVRNALMVVQFGIAILLISGTLVLWSQLDYMRTKNLGFDKEQVISLPLNTKKEHRQTLSLLRNALSEKPGILSVSAADNNLGLGKDGTRSERVLGFDYQGREVSTHMLVVDHEYTNTLGIQLLQGRSFNKDYATDTRSLLINEAMAKQLGEKNPLDAHIILNDSIRYNVVGVMRDYNFQGLEKTIKPITLFMDPEATMDYAYIKVASGNLPQSYEQVKKAWNTIAPNIEFQGSFLNENIDRTLRKERMMTTMISAGSILAIVLSCIGLFAMSLLVVAQRKKEIGIRKVVGASVSAISILLTKDFLKLVAIAFLIATPIAWWATGTWLQNYAYRIDLSIWIFLVAGLIAAVIAVATISVRTIRAALQNPVESLRTE